MILECNDTQTHSKGWPLANDRLDLYPVLSAFLLRAPMLEQRLVTFEDVHSVAILKPDVFSLDFSLTSTRVDRRQGQLRLKSQALLRKFCKKRRGSLASGRLAALAIPCNDAKESHGFSDFAADPLN